MIIDIHSHITYAHNIYETEEILKDMAIYHIDRRVISSLNGLPEAENNKNINDLVAQYPKKFIGCAVINPKSETAIEDTKAALNLEHIRMIEFNPFYHGYYPDSEGYMDEIFKLIDSRGLPVKLFTGISCYGIPQQWEKYLQRYENIPFIFLHMGCFDYGYTCVDVVERNKNAYIEISNQYEVQILRKCLYKLPPEKILFGTTFPERLTSSSLILFDQFNLDEQDRYKIFQKNNQRLLEV